MVWLEAVTSHWPAAMPSPVASGADLTVVAEGTLEAEVVQQESVITRLAWSQQAEPAPSSPARALVLIEEWEEV
jgi:hypothetical protein